MPSRDISVVVGVVFIGVASILVLAGMSDAVGSELVAFAILFFIAVVVGSVVLASRRRQVTTSGASQGEFLSDWMWSIVMVLGGLFLSFMAAFFITALLFSLAEHRLLPAAIGASLHEAHREWGGMSIVGVAWFVLQLAWIVPMGLRVYRDGMERAVEAFRMAGAFGTVSILLSGIALVTLFLLGPSR
jgi:hypothetical protein